MPVPSAPIAALSPRSSNLQMKPPTAVRKPKTDTRAKPAAPAPALNPDKIDEKWRPADAIKEPGPDGDIYLTGKKLGRGGFAVCFEGRSERNRELLALKIVRSQVAQKKQLEKFRTELQIHAKMHHPSIVEFYRAFAFEDHTYVVLELCPNGSLMDMVRHRRSLSLPEVRRYMIQLCGGVKYMHQRGVIHRDLKMGNIFIDTHMNIKIGDFGLAAVVVDDKERRQTMCGTPNYIAPELLTKTSAESGHGKKVDTWAIGIICYAMLIGTPPFASKSQTEIYAKLKQLQYEWKEDCQYFVPNQAKGLVTLCLNLVPAERPGMDDLVEHEFFKMGAIAEELDSSCLKGVPHWLEHADPRGDKVTAGYGLDHAAFCKASGVGKTLDGHVRPSMGGNVNISAMAEVALENTKGCAPVIPMPAGVVYREFTAAKEDWANVRKRPLTSSKVRSRKEQASTSGASNVNSSSSSLPETRSSSSASVSVVPSLTSNSQYPTLQRAPVQSFAAQQRQQALPSRTLNQRVVSSQTSGKTFSPKIERAQPTRESQEKLSTEQKDDANAPKVGLSSQPPRGFLLEQPIRASSRITRSSSSRDPTQNPTETALQPAKLSDRKEVIIPEPDGEAKPARARAARAKALRAALSTRSDSRYQSGNIGPDQNNSSRPQPSSSRTGSANTPLQAIDANDRQSGSAMVSEADVPKAVSPSPSNPGTPVVIASTDVSTQVTGSTPEDVLSSLRGMYRDLSQKNAVETSNSTAGHTDSANAHTVVEKWVDYSDRYGVGYILSDGSAGIALRSSADNTRRSSFGVIRNSREHYPKRVREEEMQIVPQGPNALPVEFYEAVDGEGLRKMKVPARNFRYNPSRTEQWIDSKDVVAELSRQAKSEHAAERIRILSLLDRFGKYMTNLNAASDVAPVAADAKPTSFIRFYQRLGNVGIWGFGDGAFQFNFPDHTKLLLYRSRKTEGHPLMLDLYHLQPEDARYLHRYGSMADGSMDARDSITAPVSALRGCEEDATRAHVVATNQVREKLDWIRAVVGVWVKEGGLGRTGDMTHLAWSGLQDKATERGKRASRMVWVTVGREGGDGELARRK